jgi:cytoplasmic iron level regulating protein YaaA (DUF328/UPF0246 family)
MKIVTSPAKLMNVENSTDLLKTTTPKFIEQSEFIHSYLKQKSPKYLPQKNLLLLYLPLQEKFTEVWIPKH